MEVFLALICGIWLGIELCIIAKTVNGEDEE